MSILHKAVYRLNTISVKFPHYFFIETEKKNEEIHPKNKQTKRSETTLNESASAQQKEQSTKWKGNLQHGRKYFQIIFLIRG